MANEICDNCENTNRLTVLNYATKRVKQKLTLCEDCFSNFKQLVIQLSEGG